MITGNTFLITAGPTYEKIDPVRFIGNFSSGKMGFALAKELANRGAHVILVCGPVHLSINHQNITRVDVVSAEEMHQVCIQYFPNCDGAVMCAAVADYKPEKQAMQKTKSGAGDLSIKLVPTVDIAAALGKEKKKNQLLVGFALETTNEMKNAQRKIISKNLDFIVLNSLNEKGAGFQVDTNKITIIDQHNKTTNFELKSKNDVAVDIVDRIVEEFDRL